MTRVADTSILYALFDEDDVHHGRARERIADPEPIEVPAPVLTETVDLIAYRTEWPIANDALAWLLERSHVNVADPVHVPAVQEIHEAAEGALSLTDAFVVQTCRALGADPVTADDAIARRVGGQGG